MTVGELERALSDFPKEMKVFLSADAEGNSFEAVWAVEEAFTDDLDIWRTTRPSDERVVVIWP